MSNRRRPVAVDYGAYRDEQDPQPCASCGYVTDAASEVSGRGRPTEGDVSLCFNCGAVEVFTGDGLRRRRATGDEARGVADDPKVAALQRRLRARGPLPGRSVPPEARS